MLAGTFLILCFMLIVLPNTQASLFSFQGDNRCFSKIPQLLQTKPLFNDLQCAALCSMLSNCGAFMAVKSNGSCQLYGTILSTNYANLTYVAAGVCRIALMIDPPAIAQPNNLVFNKTTNWTVPYGVYAFQGLCIGGGGGGGVGCRGGGGSGYISYGTVSVTPGTVIPVTIGSGGAAETNGNVSSIGTYIIANGGQSAITGNDGGAGGSGGGAAPGAWGVSSAAGGSGGSKGNDINGRIGGTGQGSSVWSSAVASLNLISVQITFGSGGSAVITSSSLLAPAGGGGGGILINGTGPTASNGNAPGGAAGIGGSGYGAGAGAGGNYNNAAYTASNGASGVCIITWN